MGGDYGYGRGNPAGLETRIWNSLSCMGFATLGQTIDHIEANPDFLKVGPGRRMPNFGKKSLTSLCAWMEERGVWLISTCPFCRNTASAPEDPVMFAENAQAVVCNKCGARGPDGYEGPDIKARAIELWNRRAT